MYFDKEFRLKRKYNPNFSDYMTTCKYYLKRYKENKDVKVFVDRETRELVFQSTSDTLRFY